MSASASASASAEDGIEMQCIAANTADSNPAKDATDGPQKSLEEPSETDDKKYSSGLKLHVAFLALILILLLGGLDCNIVATAVPAITDHFHTVADVGWYYTAYRLAACSLQFVFGKLYAMYSTKWIFAISNSIFLFGSILCAAATSSAMLVVGRAVTGIGIAGGAAGFFNLIVDVVPPQKRPLFGAIFGAIESLSSVVAPVLGGVITQNLTWRWCFWINVPIAGASLIAMVVLLPDSPSRQNESDTDRTWRTILSKLDIVGVVLLSSALTALFIALNWAGIVYPWNDPIIIALLVAFGILTTLLAVQQYINGDNGIMPGRLLKNRNVFAGIIFAICASSTLSILEYYAPTYFQAVHGYSPSRSGYMMFPCLIGTLIGFLVQGSGTSFFGYYTPFMIASSLLTSTATGLMTMWDPSTGIAKLIIYFAIVGFGAGIGFQCPQNAVQTALSRSDVSLGVALVLFAQNFGPALFVSLSQAIFINRLTDNLDQFTPSGTNITKIEHLGLMDIKRAYSGTELWDITSAFSQSISETWYLALGLMCFSIAGSMMTPWLSVKKKDD